MSYLRDSDTVLNVGCKC